MVPKISTVLKVVSILGLATFATLPAGCSILVVDSSPRQCSTDSDCAGRGFTDTFCSQEHVCTRAIDYCATNKECIQRTGSQQTICRKDTHKCVSLLSPQCTQVFAEPRDLEDDNAVIFGIHGIQSWSLLTQSGTNAIGMVREDFQRTQGGLPPTAATNGKARPVVHVVCDTPIGQQWLHKDISDHLFTQVGVTATQGPWSTIESTVYGMQKAVAGGAFMTTLDNMKAFAFPGLIGHVFTSFPTSVNAVAHAHAISMLEKFIRAKDPARDKLKVAYVYVNGIFEADAREFFSQVKFNDATAAQNGANYFQQFTYLPTSDPNYLSSITDTATRVKGFAPDIVVFRGGTELVSLASAIETALPNRAYYVMGVEAQPTAAAWVNSFLPPQNESLRRRVLGFAPGKYDQSDDVIALDLRYIANPSFNGRETGPSSLMHFQYDLAYMQYYAAAAVGDEPLTGTAMGKAAFERFARDGSGVDVGVTPSDILPAFAALKAGKKINLNGLMQKMAWDPVTGEPVDWYVNYWCVAPPSLLAARSSAVQNGLVSMNIEFSTANPNPGPHDNTLPGSLLDSTGKPETRLPAGCLSTE